jgi:hypothetical protein
MGSNISTNGNNIYLKQINNSSFYSFDSIYWYNFIYPATITNTTNVPITVFFTTDFILSNQRFVCGSNNITFDGQNNFINLDNNINFDGLIQNGDAGTTGFDNIVVSNILIQAQDNVTLNNNAGWICQSYFTGDVVNCHSLGIIAGEGSGGIVGAFTNNATITNCHSSGVISGDQSGGIVGASATNLTINYCYSLGNITGYQSAGIVGAFPNNSTINNCFSIGSISGNASGGIISISPTVVSVNYSYSIGDITGAGSGGICGGAFRNDEQSSSVNYCYSLGDISGYASGGIYGSEINNGLANNCYSNGFITGEYANGIYGYQDIECITSHCYISNSEWNDTTALTNLVIADIYISPKINTPFLLLSFNENFYNGATGAIVNVGQYTNLQTQFYENNFYWTTNSDIFINQSTGQLKSNVINNYDNLYVILGYPYNENLIYPPKPYNYNLINFNLIVKQNIVNNSSFNFYDKKSRKKTQKKINKFINDL